MIKHCFKRITGRLLAAAVLSGLTTGAATAQEPVKIGFIMPTKVVIGKQGMTAAQVAADMINKDGGILGGRNIQLIVHDDSFSPVEGVAAARRLINQDRVKFIAGTVNSSVALATLPVAQQANVIYMAAIPKFLGDYTYDKVFRLNTSVAMDGVAFNGFLINELKPRNFAYIGENSDFGRQMLEVFKQEFKPGGPIKIVSSGFFDQKQSDFNSLVTGAKASGADTLCINGGQVEQFANVIRAAHELGYRPRNLCLTAGLLLNAVIDLAGAPAAEGIVSSDLYLPTFDNAINRRFAAAYKEKSGADPGKTEVLGFESIWILAKAMDRAKSDTDVNAIAKVIRETTWDTPRGQIKFGAGGQASSEQYIITVRNGKIVRYK